MKIDKTQNGEDLTVALDGRLDVTTAPKFDAALGSLEGVTNLVIDMTKLEYISSAGLRVLMGALKMLNKKGGHIEIVGVNKDLWSIFELTGVIDILNVKS